MVSYQAFAQRSKEKLETTEREFLLEPAAFKADPRELYWAAGFLEGEGSFSKHQHSVRTECGQAIHEPLKRLLNVFGGSITEYKSRRYNAGKYWVWRSSGMRARGIMMTLYLLMSERRKSQIKTCLDTWKAHPVGRMLGFQKIHPLYAAKVVAEYKIGGISQRKLAAKYGLHHSTIENWLRRDRGSKSLGHGGKGVMPMPENGGI